MLYRTCGIVIRSMDYGEGNKIVTLLTNSHGKQGIVIRGAKKLKSRHGSLAQLFTHGEFVFFKKSGLGTLNHGEMIESHHLLREKLDLLAYASYAVELVDKALQDEEAGTYIFEQLKACLTALQEGKDPQVSVHLFEMKMLEAAGYAPELEVCIGCGSPDGLFSLSHRMGGTLCNRCRHQDPERLQIGEGALKLLRLFRRMDMRRLGTIQVKEETKKELKSGMRLLMDTHLGLKLKSRSFLDQMEELDLRN
ncbi:DNA repair protein RecO [Paenibacillus tarimensis]